MVNITYFQLFQLFLLTIGSVCGIISLFVSIQAMIKVEAIKQSTHNIEYVPADPNWATSDQQIQEMEQESADDLDPMEDDELEESELDLKKLI